MATGDLEKTKWYLKNVVGVSEEDLNTLLSNPGGASFLEKMPELSGSEIVASVLGDPGPKYCSAHLKPGQKLVFDLMPVMVNKEKSDCPLCARAIEAVSKLAPGIWGAVIGGVELKPTQIGCPDPGIQKGGLGHVEFEVSIRKKSA